MIEGYVSPKLEPTIELTIVGAHLREERIEVIIDTAFTGHLTLPLARIQSFGWIYRSDEPVFLADGSSRMVPIYRRIVMWHGQPRLITAFVSESNSMIGADMLDGSELKIEFRRGGKVTITPLP